MVEIGILRTEVRFRRAGRSPWDPGSVCSDRGEIEQSGQRAPQCRAVNCCGSPVVSVGHLWGVLPGRGGQ